MVSLSYSKSTHIHTCAVKAKQGVVKYGQLRHLEETFVNIQYLWLQNSNHLW